MIKNDENNQLKLGLHISYDNDLSIKDLVDILDLYRKSMNKNMRDFGVKTVGLNKYCRIQSVNKGSIDINLVLGAIIALGNIAVFGNNLLEIIKKSISNKKERLRRENNHDDNPVYARNEMSININGGVVNIHIHNSNEKLDDNIIIDGLKK